MWQSIQAWFVKQFVGGGVLGKIALGLGFLKGKRTQVLMGLYAFVEVLKLAGVLDVQQAESVKNILEPIAGATFAAKISRLGGLADKVLPRDGKPS